jgi:hypothetical protein
MSGHHQEILWLNDAKQLRDYFTRDYRCRRYQPTLNQSLPERCEVLRRSRFLSLDPLECGRQGSLLDAQPDSTDSRQRRGVDDLHQVHWCTCRPRDCLSMGEGIFREFAAIQRHDDPLVDDALGFALGCCHGVLPV